MTEKYISDMVPYYGTCRGYEDKEAEAHIQKDTIYEEPGSVDTSGAEGFIRSFIDSYTPKLYLDEKMLHNSYLLACDGAPIDGRRIKKSVLNYLLDNYSFIIEFIVLSNPFRNKVYEAIKQEIHLDQIDEEEVILAREEMKEDGMQSKSLEIPEGFYQALSMIGIKEDSMQANPLEESIVIDFSELDDVIADKICKRIQKSVDEIPFFESQLQEEIDQLTKDFQLAEDYLIEAGYIFSNWIYLIRAFDKNSSFLSYVKDAVGMLKILNQWFKVGIPNGIH